MPRYNRRKTLIAKNAPPDTRKNPDGVEISLGDEASSPQSPGFGVNGRAHRLRMAGRTPGGFEPQVRPNHVDKVPDGTTGVAE
jgi:hypothetical protein